MAQPSFTPSDGDTSRAPDRPLRHPVAVDAEPERVLAALTPAPCTAAGPTPRAAAEAAPRGVVVTATVVDPAPAVVPAHGVFTVAQGRSAGLTARDLRSPLLHRPLRGLRAVAAPTTLEERCRCALAVAPAGSAISHLTAATLHGLWLPRIPDDRVHLCRPEGSHRQRRPQLASHRGLGDRVIETLHGLPVVAAADTWADLRGTLTLEDLVAAGDGIARFDGGPQALADAVRRRVARRAPGVVTLRHALARIRPGSASRAESLTRWALVAGGVPEPALNYDIKDSAGEWIAKVDLAWEQARVCAEYQSTQFHSRDPGSGPGRDRPAIDEFRRRQIEDLGWMMVFVYPADVYVTAKSHAFVTRMGRLIHERSRRR